MCVFFFLFFLLVTSLPVSRRESRQLRNQCFVQLVVSDIVHVNVSFLSPQPSACASLSIMATYCSLQATSMCLPAATTVWPFIEPPATLGFVRWLTNESKRTGQPNQGRNEVSNTVPPASLSVSLCLQTSLAAVPDKPVYLPTHTDTISPRQQSISQSPSGPPPACVTSDGGCCCCVSGWGIGRAAAVSMSARERSRRSGLGRAESE